MKFPLKSALSLILQPLKLNYVIKDEVLKSPASNSAAATLSGGL